MNNKYYMLVPLLAALAAGCATIPAEETIAETGAMSINCSFEVPTKVGAEWHTTDKVVVVDSENKTTKFDYQTGDGNFAEFSGEITPKSVVKYVAYSGDFKTIEYKPDDSTFVLDIPGEYFANAANAVVTANNASVGVLSGSEVEMKAVGGFIKVTFGSNGTTAQVAGEEYKVTDICKIVIADSLKSLAGRVAVKIQGDKHEPVIVDTLSYVDSLVFTPLSVNSADGHTYYVAGDYYLPVLPLTYEHVSINIYDADGNITKGYIKEKTLDVHRAAASNAGTVDWPCIELVGNFAGANTGLTATGFGSNNLGCDRVATDGTFAAGATKKNQFLTLENGGVKYKCITSMGFGASTSSGNVVCMLVNKYTAAWSYQSKTWLVGSTAERAYVEIPAQAGVLSKFTISCYSGSMTDIIITDQVNPDTYGVAGTVLARIPTTSAKKKTEVAIKGGVKNTVYYIVFTEGYSYMVYDWSIKYKLFQDK